MANFDRKRCMRMSGLGWFATTPEGERLGKMAAQMVRWEIVPLPWWLAPLEPLRWMDALVSEAPHAKVTAMIYGTIASAVGLMVLWRCRRVRWQSLCLAALAAFNTLLTLVGLHLTMMWLRTVIPYGARWVVPADAPFVLANFHAHSHFSAGGILLPGRLIVWHWRKGYRVVAVTDSNTVRGSLLAESFVRRRRLPIVVVAGEEFRGRTHLLLLGVRRDIVPGQAGVADAIRFVRHLGGLAIAAHAWTGRYSYDTLQAWGVDGFEIANSTTLADERLQNLCRHHKLLALGNLDFREGNLPKVATVLPAGVQTSAQVLAALRQRRCAVLFVRQVQVGYHWLHARLSRVAELWETGKTASLLGFGLWLAAGWCFRRRRFKRQPRKNPCPSRGWGMVIGVQILLGVVVGVLGIWALAADFKRGWFPPIESAIAAWAVACPLNWWLWSKGTPIATFSPSRLEAGE